MVTLMKFFTEYIRRLLTIEKDDSSKDDLRRDEKELKTKEFTGPNEDLFPEIKYIPPKRNLQPERKLDVLPGISLDDHIMSTFTTTSLSDRQSFKSQEYVHDIDDNATVSSTNTIDAFTLNDRISVSNLNESISTSSFTVPFLNSNTSFNNNGDLFPKIDYTQFDPRSPNYVSIQPCA